jgi:hypothetical protein
VSEWCSCAGSRRGRVVERGVADARRAVARVTAGRGGHAALSLRDRPSGLKGAPHRSATAYGRP